MNFNWGAISIMRVKEEFQGSFQAIVDFDDANVAKRVVGNDDGGIKFELVNELVGERIRRGGSTT
jgi:hypothetical protein